VEAWNGPESMQLVERADAYGCQNSPSTQAGQLD
jgi:hypothetical protein